MTISELHIAELVTRYKREHDRYRKLADFVSDEVKAALRDAGLPALVTHRAKDPRSFHTTLQRKCGRRRREQFAGELSEGLTDLAGVRVLLYRPEDKDAAERAILAKLELSSSRDSPREDHCKESGYRALHLLVEIPDSRAHGDRENLRGTCCEIQIVHLLDHVYNELEHDIQYKTPGGRPTELQGEFLVLLRSGLNTAGKGVELLMGETARALAHANAEISSPGDLRRVLEARFGRTLQGEFGRLLELLEATCREVKPREFDELPLDPEALGRAEQRLRELCIVNEAQEVGLIIAALWDSHGLEFVELAQAWRGRPGPSRRLLEQLHERLGGGTDGHS